MQCLWTVSYTHLDVYKRQAEIAQEMGIETIGIVTKPFAFEGNARAAKARSCLLYTS